MKPFALGLLLSTFFLAPVLLRAEEKETEMEKAMEVLDKAYKNLNNALKAPDAGQKDAYLQWADTIKTQATKAVEMVPAKIAAMPKDQQGPVLEAYQKDMKKFIETVDELKKAIQEDKWTDAAKLCLEMKKERNHGHEEYRVQE